LKNSTKGEEVKVIHTKGDLVKLAIAGEFDVIVHGCNCFCTMGSGIAASIRSRYPGVYEADLKTESGSKEKLGTYSKAEADGFTVINAYTQFYFNRGGTAFRDVFEYEAFKKILDSLSIAYPKARFGFPYIGMGLAGGDPKRIAKMIEDFSDRVETTGGTVTLVEFGA
jgi:O-acetyl-ADP-ribose deacetylase (regulator of RNase III)